MKEFKNITSLQKIAIVLIAIGATSIFPEHGSSLHKTLQVIFVLGLLCYVIPVKSRKKADNQ